MDDKATGILRSRDRDDGDDLVVAELTVKPKPTGDSRMLNEADLLVFRSGEWRSIRTKPIGHASSSSPSTRWPWKTDMVVPVADRLLCWVDLYHGFIFSDVFDDNPRLQYVPLPEPPAMDTEGEPRCDSDSDDDDDDRRRPPCPTLSRTVGGAALKFVDVSPRCCCGSRAATFCHSSRLAFVIRTWTLKIGHDGDSSNMAWNMDAMVDATELWALDAYAGLPRVHVEHPLVSMDDPHLIRFVVCEEFQRRNFGHKKSKTWMIMVDARRKTMTSVTTRLGFGRQPYPGSTYLPSGFSDYFNSYRGGSNGGGASSSTSEIVIAEPRPRTNGIAVNNPLRISCSSGSSSKDLKVASPEEIFMTLERIPEMARDDLLKAYTILNQDNGRWFRSLLGLPMTLRKDWLLMMIKIQEW
uniref:DUF1618 domain-containing protein n=1 Tax=Oryza meridionalis TaxID=40149 RepID=A0A0E0F325_9ORYZ